jgi:sensor domain CHASE-containing protein
MIRHINISSVMTVLLIISTLSMTVALFKLDKAEVSRKHHENIDKIQTTLENELALALQIPRRLGRFVYTTPTLGEPEFSALSEEFRPPLPLTNENPVQSR